MPPVVLTPKGPVNLAAVVPYLRLVLLTHRKRELERLHDEQTGQLRALRAATDTTSGGNDGEEADDDGRASDPDTAEEASSDDEDGMGADTDTPPVRTPQSEVAALSATSTVPWVTRLLVIIV
eukprot:TRINITY_DN2642_c0_g3_i3.p1 TRINITY_DN2642_c0_g3~~TRINITY_DN2642_c0_g3_i3.p1  ORF type:complete len:143 (-),score=7.94 TRINITY_DN2642_c0_g3_i3:88-456(-)